MPPGLDYLLSSLLEPDLSRHSRWAILAIGHHANILHIGLNMFNFSLLGLIVERISRHRRFILIYLLTGVISALASCVFAFQEISVGVSGAIFSLVGAFILVHRQAFRSHGSTALGWLILVMSMNLGLACVIPTRDNYAHVGGLLSGCLLGWFFTPFYKVNSVAIAQNGPFMLTDIHGLKCRWPLAFC